MGVDKMKNEILNLFMELLKEWEIAEEVVINDRGSIDDYDILDIRKKEYINKINELLSKIIQG